MIGKISRVPLREVWKHEAANFTTWLLANTDVLSEIVGVELQNAEREKAAGDFNVDIVAEDEAGNVVVIENQLNKSDHDHLGKIITYVAALGARMAIWIVSEPRPEHISAITWLNEAQLANFFLLKLEAIRIGTSDPAPLLTLITGPSKETREIGETKKDVAERYEIRREFWTSLLALAKTRTNLHSTISPSDYGWIATSAGRAGLTYLYAVTKHGMSTELVIDTGDQAENWRLFEILKHQQRSIQADFGASLEWYRQEGVRLCRIRAVLKAGGYRDAVEKWPEIQGAAIDAMIRLESALKPHLARIE
jgi:hypothetical protein